MLGHRLAVVAIGSLLAAPLASAYSCTPNCKFPGTFHNADGNETLLAIDITAWNTCKGATSNDTCASISGCNWASFFSHCSPASFNPSACIMGTCSPYWCVESKSCTSPSCDECSTSCSTCTCSTPLSSADFDCPANPYGNVGTTRTSAGATVRQGLLAVLLLLVAGLLV